MGSEEVIFQMILHGGNARSSAMEAVSFAKKGEVSEAQAKLKEADEELNVAHQQQTDLLQKETEGAQSEVTLLLAHALDHFMNAETVKDMATEFVDLYDKLNIPGEVSEK